MLRHDPHHPWGGMVACTLMSPKWVLRESDVHLVLSFSFFPQIYIALMTYNPNLKEAIMKGTLTKKQKLAMLNRLKHCVLAGKLAIMERFLFVRIDNEMERSILDQFRNTIDKILGIIGEMIEQVKSLPRSSSRHEIYAEYVILFDMHYTDAAVSVVALRDYRYEMQSMPQLLFYHSMLSLLRNTCYAYRDLIMVLDIKEPELSEDLKSLLHLEGDKTDMRIQFCRANAMSIHRDIKKYRQTMKTPIDS